MHIIFLVWSHDYTFIWSQFVLSCDAITIFRMTLLFWKNLIANYFQAVPLVAYIFTHHAYLSGRIPWLYMYMIASTVVSWCIYHLSYEPMIFKYYLTTYFFQVVRLLACFFHTWCISSFWYDLMITLLSDHNLFLWCIYHLSYDLMILKKSDCQLFPSCTFSCLYFHTSCISFG